MTDRKSAVAGRLQPLVARPANLTVRVHISGNFSVTIVQTTLGRTYVAPVLAAIACAAYSDTASANGFFVNQQSVSGFGRADAGNAAAASDATTIFFNPAGLTHIWGNAGANTEVSVGAHLIIGRSSFNNTGSTAATPFTGGFDVPYAGADARNPVDPTPVANAYVARRVNRDLSLGLGISTPFGLASKFDRDWFGRYDSIEAKLLTLNFGPVVAYRLNDLVSIGGGVDIQYARSKLVSAIPDPFNFGGPTPPTDAYTEADGDSFGFGYNIGVLLTPSERVRIGLHYRSGIDHEFEGRVITQGLTGLLQPFNGAVGAKTDLALPAIASLAAAVQLTERLQVLADVTWFGWSDLKELRFRFDDATPDAVRVTNYRDGYTFGLGFEYQASADLTLRTGFRYDRTPTVDATRDTTLADSNRYWLALGASYRLTPALTLDMAYSHVFFDGARIDVSRTFFDGTPAASAVDLAADVKSQSDNVSFNLRYRY